MGKRGAGRSKGGLGEVGMGRKREGSVKMIWKREWRGWKGLEERRG